MPVIREQEEPRSSADSPVDVAEEVDADADADARPSTELRISRHSHFSGEDESVRDVRRYYDHVVEGLQEELASLYDGIYARKETTTNVLLRALGFANEGTRGVGRRMSDLRAMAAASAAGCWTVEVEMPVSVSDSSDDERDSVDSDWGLNVSKGPEARAEKAAKKAKAKEALKVSELVPVSVAGRSWLARWTLLSWRRVVEQERGSSKVSQSVQDKIDVAEKAAENSAASAADAKSRLADLTSENSILKAELERERGKTRNNAQLESDLRAKDDLLLQLKKDVGVAKEHIAVQKEDLKDAKQEVREHRKSTRTLEKEAMAAAEEATKAKKKAEKEKKKFDEALAKHQEKVEAERKQEREAMKAQMREAALLELQQDPVLLEDVRRKSLTAGGVTAGAAAGETIGSAALKEAEAAAKAAAQTVEEQNMLIGDLLKKAGQDDRDGRFSTASIESLTFEIECVQKEVKKGRRQSALLAMQLRQIQAGQGGKTAEVFGGRFATAGDLNFASALLHQSAAGTLIAPAASAYTVRKSHQGLTDDLDFGAVPLDGDYSAAALGLEPGTRASAFDPAGAGAYGAMIAEMMAQNVSGEQKKQAVNAKSDADGAALDEATLDDKPLWPGGPPRRDLRAQRRRLSMLGQPDSGDNARFQAPTGAAASLAAAQERRHAQLRAAGLPIPPVHGDLALLGSDSPLANIRGAMHATEVRQLRTEHAIKSGEAQMHAAEVDRLLKELAAAKEALKDEVAAHRKTQRMLLTPGSREEMEAAERKALEEQVKVLKEAGQAAVKELKEKDATVALASLGKKVSVFLSCLDRSLAVINNVKTISQVFGGWARLVDRSRWEVFNKWLRLVGIRPKPEEADGVAGVLEEHATHHPGSGIKHELRHANMLGIKSPRPGDGLSPGIIGQSAVDLTVTSVGHMATELKSGYRSDAARMDVLNQTDIQEIARMQDRIPPSFDQLKFLMEVSGHVNEDERDQRARVGKKLGQEKSEKAALARQEKRLRAAQASAGGSLSASATPRSRQRHGDDVVHGISPRPGESPRSARSPSASPGDGMRAAVAHNIPASGVKSSQNPGGAFLPARMLSPQGRSRVQAKRDRNGVMDLSPTGTKVDRFGTMEQISGSGGDSPPMYSTRLLTLGDKALDQERAIREATGGGAGGASASARQRSRSLTPPIVRTPARSKQTLEALGDATHAVFGAAGFTGPWDGTVEHIQVEGSKGQGKRGKGKGKGLRATGTKELQGRGRSPGPGGAMVDLANRGLTKSESLINKLDRIGREMRDRTASETALASAAMRNLASNVHDVTGRSPGSNAPSSPAVSPFGRFGPPVSELNDDELHAMTEGARPRSRSPVRAPYSGEGNTDPANYPGSDGRRETSLLPRLPIKGMLGEGETPVPVPMPKSGPGSTGTDYAAALAGAQNKAQSALIGIQQSLDAQIRSLNATAAAKSTPQKELLRDFAAREGMRSRSVTPRPQPAASDVENPQFFRARDQEIMNIVSQPASGFVPATEVSRAQLGIGRASGGVASGSGTSDWADALNPAYIAGAHPDGPPGADGDRLAFPRAVPTVAELHALQRGYHESTHNHNTAMPLSAAKAASLVRSRNATGQRAASYDVGEHRTNEMLRDLRDIQMDFMQSKLDDDGGMTPRGRAAHIGRMEQTRARGEGPTGSSGVWPPRKSYGRRAASADAADANMRAANEELGRLGAAVAATDKTSLAQQAASAANPFQIPAELVSAAQQIRQATASLQAKPTNEAALAAKSAAQDAMSLFSGQQQPQTYSSYIDTLAEQSTTAVARAYGAAGGPEGNGLARGLASSPLRKRVSQWDIKDFSPYRTRVDAAKRVAKQTMDGAAIQQQGRVGDINRQTMFGGAATSTVGDPTAAADPSKRTPMSNPKKPAETPVEPFLGGGERRAHDPTVVVEHKKQVRAAEEQRRTEVRSVLQARAEMARKGQAFAPVSSVDESRMSESERQLLAIAAPDGRPIKLDDGLQKQAVQRALTVQEQQRAQKKERDILRATAIAQNHNKGVISSIDPADANIDPATRAKAGFLLEHGSKSAATLLHEDGLGVKDVRELDPLVQKGINKGDTFTVQAEDFQNRMKALGADPIQSAADRAQESADADVRMDLAAVDAELSLAAAALEMNPDDSQAAVAFTIAEAKMLALQRQRKRVQQLAAKEGRSFKPKWFTADRGDPLRERLHQAARDRLETAALGGKHGLGKDLGQRFNMFSGPNSGSLELLKRERAIAAKERELQRKQARILKKGETHWARRTREATEAKYASRDAEKRRHNDEEKLLERIRAFSLPPEKWLKEFGEANKNALAMVPVQSAVHGGVATGTSASSVGGLKQFEGVLVNRGGVDPQTGMYYASEDETHPLYARRAASPGGDARGFRDMSALFAQHMDRGMQGFLQNNEQRLRQLKREEALQGEIDGFNERLGLRDEERKKQIEMVRDRANATRGSLVKPHGELDNQDYTTRKRRLSQTEPGIAAIQSQINRTKYGALASTAAANAVNTDLFEAVKAKRQGAVPGGRDAKSLPAPRWRHATYLEEALTSGVDPLIDPKMRGVTQDENVAREHAGRVDLLAHARQGIFENMGGKFVNADPNLQEEAQGAVAIQDPDAQSTETQAQGQEMTQGLGARTRMAEKRRLDHFMKNEQLLRGIGSDQKTRELAQIRSTNFVEQGGGGQGFYRTAHGPGQLQARVHLLGHGVPALAEQKAVGAGKEVTAETAKVATVPFAEVPADADSPTGPGPTGDGAAQAEFRRRSASRAAAAAATEASDAKAISQPRLSSQSPPPQAQARITNTNLSRPSTSGGGTPGVALQQAAAQAVVDGAASGLGAAAASQPSYQQFTPGQIPQEEAQRREKIDALSGMNGIRAQTLRKTLLQESAAWQADAIIAQAQAEVAAGGGTEEIVATSGGTTPGAAAATSEMSAAALADQILANAQKTVLAGPAFQQTGSAHRPSQMQAAQPPTAVPIPRASQTQQRVSQLEQPTAQLGGLPEEVKRPSAQKQRPDVTRTRRSFGEGGGGAPINLMQEESAHFAAATAMPTRNDTSTYFAGVDVAGQIPAGQIPAAGTGSRSTVLARNGFGNFVRSGPVEGAGAPGAGGGEDPASRPANPATDFLMNVVSTERTLDAGVPQADLETGRAAAAAAEQAAASARATAEVRGTAAVQGAPAPPPSHPAGATPRGSRTTFKPFQPLQRN